MLEAPDGQPAIDVKLDHETVCLNLKQITSLFGRDKSVILRHIANIFKENELVQDSVVTNNATTVPDGKTYHVLKNLTPVGHP